MAIDAFTLLVVGDICSVAVYRLSVELEPQEIPKSAGALYLSKCWHSKYGLR